MNLRHPRWRKVLGLGLLALVLTAAVSGGQEPPAPAADGKAIDQQLFIVLRDVINRGRDHYNNGDPAACYHMFHGALQITRPMLAHRPELQKAVQDGMAEAEAQPDMRRRAWVLRNVMDRVRNEVKGETTKVDPAKPELLPPNGKPAERIGAKPAEVKLWDRLGGLDAVTKVVDDFVALAAEDPKVNFTRDGKLKFTDEQVAALKKSLVAFVSAASGGPLKYTGKSMKESHQGLGVTDAEFDATVDVLLKALDKNGVKEEEAKALRAAVETTRKDIVQKKEE
ncbi:MAG: group 1 truncated hemoglobin [Planctomycetia bacterium]|nr:group 1 truncated hemoglobin [Planctomycetia bacterium]